MDATETTQERQYTAQEFYELEDAVGYELRDGVLVERPVSRRSAGIGGHVLAELYVFGRSRKAGKAWGPDLGLQIYSGRPNRLPRADAVFVSTKRLATLPAHDTPYLNVATDLAVEVVSPTNGAKDIDRKVAEYLEGGVDVVWVVYPETRHAFVHQANGTVELVPPTGSLRGEGALKGFELPLAELFEDE